MIRIVWCAHRVAYGLENVVREEKSEIMSLWNMKSNLSDKHWKEQKIVFFLLIEMENLFEDDVSVQEMELLEPNYEVFMKWAQPTTIWDIISNRIRMATIR